MSTMTPPDHRVKPSKFTPPRIRHIFILVHLIVIVGYFVLSFLHGSFLWVASLVSFVPALIYLPAALWLAHIRSSRVFDRAGAEVAYLSIQLALWFSIVVLGLAFRGPTYCAEWSYLLGRIDQSAQQDADAGLGVQISTDATVIHTCDVDIVLNVFSCLHFVWMGIWIGWIVRVVRRLPMSRKEGFRCGVSGLLRGDYEVAQGEGEGKRGDVELGTLDSERTNDGVDMPGGIEGRTISSSTSAGPPRLPPRPGTLPELEVSDIPPPAYEPGLQPTSQARALPVPPSNGLIDETTGEPMDFDRFMRVQQQKMEYKLLVERHGLNTPPSGSSPVTLGNPVQGPSIGRGMDGVAGPSRRRRVSA